MPRDRQSGGFGKTEKIFKILKTIILHSHNKKSVLTKVCVNSVAELTELVLK